MAIGSQKLPRGGRYVWKIISVDMGSAGDPWTHIGIIDTKDTQIDDKSHWHGHHVGKLPKGTACYFYHGHGNIVRLDWNEQGGWGPLRTKLAKFQKNKMILSFLFDSINWTLGFWLDNTFLGRIDIEKDRDYYPFVSFHTCKEFKVICA